jgi:hypothetical protein
MKPMTIRANQKRPARFVGARGGRPAGKIRQAASGKQPPGPARANVDLSAPEFFMVKGVSAVENAELQRLGNAVEERLFKRRVKHPSRTLARVRSALRRMAWTHVRAQWCGTSSVQVRAEFGKRKTARMKTFKFLTTHDWLFSDLAQAAREVGFEPGIEDICINVKGRKIEAVASAVPLVVIDAALDKMMKRWRGSRQLKRGRGETVKMG